MIYKKTALQITIMSICIALALQAELPLTDIKGLAAPFRTSRQTIVAAPPAAGPATAAAGIAEQNVFADDNIFSPIYGVLAWHSPYLLNLWQLDTESATAKLAHRLFYLQHDGATFDVSGVPDNTISHLSCENIGYIIGLLYNYEQAMNAYQKQVIENTVLLQAEIAKQEALSGGVAQQGEASPRIEQPRTPSPGIVEQGAGSPHGKQKGKKSPQSITPFQEKQREFSAYKNKELRKIKKELTDKLTTYIETLNPAAVKHNIITYYSSQITHLDADIAREQDEAKIQVLQRKKTDLESELANKRSDDIIMFRAYNEGKDNFVNDIVVSMLDIRYLPHNTILLLLSCMWKKANNYEDIMHYMYGMYSALDNKAALFKDAINIQLHGMSRTAPTRTATSVTATPTFTEPAAQASPYQAFASILMPKITQSPYTAIEYKALLQRNPAELYTNLADYAFAFCGFDIFGDNATLLPAEVSMLMRAQYGETEFPDCGETSLLNFFAAILYNPTEKNWNIDLLNKINADQKLTQFFIDFSPSTLNTQDAHNRWAMVASSKAGVNYALNTCEIDAGMDNMLKVIAALIPGANTFEDLARILNSNGVQITFGIPAGVDRYGEITIQLIKNDQPLTLVWTFNSGHFHLSFPLKTIILDQRTQILHTTPFNAAIASDILLQALLIRYYNMQPLDALQVMHYYQAFVYDIQMPEDLLKMVKRIALLQDSILYKIPLIRSLYNTLSHKQIALHDQNMYLRDFWQIIKETNTNPENIVLDKDIDSMTDIQKERYIEALLSQTITNAIFEKIQKIIPTIQTDSKDSIINAILQKDPTTAGIQQLYALIIPMIPTIQDDASKCLIVSTILRKDPTTPIVQQLYTSIIPMIPTIQDDASKWLIAITILRKDPTIPVVRQLYESIPQILSTIQDDTIKEMFIKTILQKDPTIPVVQQLYESIIPIIPTIQNDYSKQSIIEAILQKDPRIHAVQELYRAIKPLISTMQREDTKSKIRELLLKKDQSIPVVQELLQVTQ